MREWISEHQAFLWWLGVFSAIAAIASVVTGPWFLVRLPEDYLTRDHSHDVFLPKVHPLIRWPTLVLKNALGLTLVLAGIAMLVLPGQGVLAMVAGLMLLDIPGRRRAVRWIMGRKKVLRGINWIRRKGHHPPLHPPHPSGGQQE